MFKGLGRLVPETELNLTNENQQSATNRSGSVHITKYKGRKHNTPSVALQTRCAATTAIATEVGQNETDTDPREQVLRWQLFRACVAVCECLQSHSPE